MAARVAAWGITPSRADPELDTCSPEDCHALCCARVVAMALTSPGGLPVPLLTRRWEERSLPPDGFLDRFPDVPDLALQILYRRGVREPEEVQAFLGSRLVLNSPFCLKGMHQAVAHIRQAIRGQEPIAVYGDFDADGVTATVLLVQTLEALGARAMPYIPHRVDEGYGLHEAALAHLAKQGIRVVVTADCGIRSIGEVEYGRALGLDMIITDHHSVGAELPPANAVIDPQRPDCSYPFKQLAGVGVAFKLAQALLCVADAMRPKGSGPMPLLEDDLLDLVALGTVADIVPLLGENRMLVKQGLARLNPSSIEARDRPRATRESEETGAQLASRCKSEAVPRYPTRPGLRALMKTAGLARGEVSSGTIGFALGPRLNAAGRLESAMLSYELLSTQEPEKADDLAHKLDQLNRERQRLTQETIARVHDEIDGAPDALLHFVARDDINPGVAGLVASRLADEYYRPAVVVERGAEESRGSARSIAGFDITHALDRCQELLLRHGGHAAAAGFTTATRHLPALEARLKQIANDDLVGADLVPTLSIDAEIGLDELSWSTHALLQQFEPCGHGNPTPVLVSRGVEVRRHSRVGSDGQHLKLVLSDGQRSWDAIAFRQGDWAARMPERVDVAYSLEVNEWNGRRLLQLNVQDLRPSEL